MSDRDPKIAALVQTWIDGKLPYEIANDENVPTEYIEAVILYFLTSYYGKEMKFHGDVGKYKDWFSKQAMRNYHHQRVQS
jgi:hypothetical protein